MITTKVGGDLGEKQAWQYLEKLGYKILFKNFRSIFGEIDIIAQEKDTVIFVEVKKRNSIKYGYPEEAVTMQKLERIHKTIDYFFIKYPAYSQYPKRVDVIAIMVSEGRVSVKHIRNV